MRTIPLVLAEATLTLFPADAQGDPIRSEPVWIGARVEGLEINSSIEEIESTPSGAPQRQFEQGSLSYLITVQRIRVVPTSTLRGFSLARGRFVLDVLHSARRSDTYHRLTFYGVTMLNHRIQSRGLMEHAEDQRFRAETVTEEAGRLPATPLAQFVPNTPAILFTREGPLATGDFLTGAYSFDRPVLLTSAYAVGLASQGLPTTLRLIQDGSATPHNLVLPAGAGETSASVSLNRTVQGGAVLRWKVESAPVINQATRVSVAVNLQAL